MEDVHDETAIDPMLIMGPLFWMALAAFLVPFQVYVSGRLYGDSLQMRWYVGAQEI